jgi:hypothetical protein
VLRGLIAWRRVRRKKLTPAEPKPTPWARWIEIGLGHLGFAPAVFWTLSFIEWNAAVTGYREKVTGSREDGPGESMSRADFERLAEAYPDGCDDS